MIKKKTTERMMNPMYKYLLLFLGITMVVSCDSFLDQVPDNRANPTTPEEVSELLVSAYPEVAYVSFAELMSDNAGDVGKWSMGYDRNHEECYYWKYVTGDDVDSPAGFWDASYTAIATANHALAIIEKAAEADRVKYLHQRGEALLCRAYNHFMMLLFFADTYHPTKSATALGIPYVTVPENVPIKDYKRNTVEECYNFIEKDMLEGIALIDDGKYSVPKYHFTKAAAYAFAARFYQMRGLVTAEKNDWQQVLLYANKVLPAEPSSMLRAWNTTYSGFSYNQLETEYTKATENCNILLIGQVSIWGRYPMYRYHLTDAIRKEILERMQPYGTYASIDFNFFGGSTFLHIPKFKEHFKSVSLNANTGWPYVMFTAFTTDELLLNRVEAKIMLGDEAGALSDMNSYYKMRIDRGDNKNIPPKDKVTTASVEKYITTVYTASNPKPVLNPYYTIPAHLTNLMIALVDARRIEFLEEGLRWFDIRRFDLPVKHVSFNEKTSLTLPSVSQGGYRTLQIPTQAVSLGLERNKDMVTK